MEKMYIVYQGDAYRNFSSTKDGVYLYIYDVDTTPVGFERYEDYYRKHIKNEDIDQIYSIIDLAVYKGREFDIVGSSRDNYLNPDSWVRIVTEDIAFLEEHNVWKDELIYDNQYGRKFYASDALPMEEVTILRSRKILPRR